MKKFVYQVQGYEFTDTVPFGKAWQEAFVKGGCFLSVTLAPIENVMMF